MLTRLLCLTLIVAMPFLTFAQTGVTASFTAPDSVCAGKSVQFTNTSIGATNYYWSFCAANFNTTPEAINIGDPNNTLNSPVFMDYSLDDNGNYYGFSTNYNYGHLIRLNFGNSLLNTPTANDLGTLNTIPSYAEGVQVKKVNGQCYVFIVSAGDQTGTNSALTRVDFGNSFSNNPIAATNLGNIGGLNFPHELFITQYNNNFYGFTVNINDNTITRFDFGNSLANQPTGTNLGNIGNLDYPCGFSFINNNGSWYAFITNRNSNSISRLDFGKSLSNTPSGININNPSDILYRPRDISIFESCNGVVGLIVNEEDETTGEITKLNFGSDILSTSPSATNLGNIGELKFPHSISKFFLEGNDIYSFITNVSNNTITRLRYVGCTNTSIPSSTQQTPPSVTYTEPGTYNVNLLVDIGLPTETSFCKQIVVKDCTPVVTASFTTADTVCINTPLKITNTSTNATSYYWSFCQADINKTPEGQNLGNINSAFALPVYSDIVSQNGNYYVFVVNNYPSGLTRLDFGNSLLNTPSVVKLGNFGGLLENNAEGIQVVNTGNHWYAILVGGSTPAGTTPQILKLDFGSDVTNILPSPTNWGNIGNMAYPHKLFIFNENKNWYGFTANSDNNTITRFDFGADFTNPPTGTNLGNFGMLSGPTGISPVKDNTNWYLFITNAVGNSITRLNFGASLLSIPSAKNLGDLNGTMHECFDIYIQKYCDQIIGFVVNGSDAYNDIVRLDFHNNITSTPTAVSLGNIGTLSLPHSFSKLFRVGNDLYNFIPNAHNNTLTRLKFTGCTNSSIPSSTQANPPTVTYDSAGVYNISLSVDEGLPTQTSYCKQIIVKDCKNPCDSFKVDAGKNVSICYGTSVQLKATGAAIYKWNKSTALSDTTIANPVANPLTTTEFIVTGYNSTRVCSDTDTVKVTVLPLPVFTINNDTSICKGSSVNLHASGNNNYHYHWMPSTYLSDTSIANPVSNPSDTIKYFVTATDSNSCASSDSIQINVVPKPFVTTINDTSICFGTTILLTTNATDANKFIWSPSSGLNNTSTQSPQATPASTTTYTVVASNSLCSSKDSVHVTILSLPTVSAGKDTIICDEGVARLHASGAVSYTWSPAATLSNPNISDPVAVPVVTTIYHVSGTGDNNCINTDSVTVFKQPDPVFAVIPVDSSICSGQKITLSASGGDTYNWSPSQTLSSSTSATTIASPLAVTKYSVFIYDSTCKVSSTLSSTISINASPIVTITKSNDIDCSNPQAQLTATGGATYSWLPATAITDTQIANPVVNPTSDTWYSVTVANTNGCITHDSILVKSTLGDQGMYVPNAFTPNGDGRNDCFGVHYWGQATSFDMKIFDKWGMMVYHSQNVGECWDGSYKGKKQGSGTFVYMIKAASACGKQDIFRKGTVVLIR